jgi:glycosyltransferase involved in cell wall biosynthesis
VSNPLISIVIPFYESYAEHLGVCLDSVLQQTYQHWELIVVDDASTTEAGREIVERLGDPRIRIVRHEQNRGQAAGRNTGFRLSTGELIVPLDCDDYLAPTHLEKLLQALHDSPDCNAAYADYQLFSEVSGYLAWPVGDTYSLLKEQWIPHPGTMMHRSLWEQSGGYCEDEVLRSGNEDWDYFLSLVEVGLKAVRVPEPLYFYRQHENSISTTKFLLKDYLMRELMYARHQRLFDNFRMGRLFLAAGYRSSGKAHWQTGDRLHGLQLLLRAAWLDPAGFFEAVFSNVREQLLPHRHPYR